MTFPRFRAPAALLLPVLSLLNSTHVTADVSLATMFSDRVVLQAEVAVPVWGWADASEEVSVSISGQIKTTKSDAAGNWRLTLDPLKAGEVGAMTVRAKNTITIRDVLAGEVWLASGQSNMHANLGVRHPDKEKILDESDDPWVRQFTVVRNDNLESPRDLAGVWRAANRANLTSSRLHGDSSVAYFFSRELRKKLDRPIGVLHASVGATPIQAWSPGGRSYHTMIEPLAPFKIRGALWYQGESNFERNQTAEYTELFTQHVAAWRKLWGQGEFPFFFVQLAPFRYSQKTAGPLKDHSVGPLELPYFWEVQAALRNKVPNSGIAVIHDSVPDSDIDNIHPQNKRIPGERLAALALAKIYGHKDVTCEGPFYREMSAEGAKIRVKFTGIGTGLATRDGQAPNLFEIAGEDRKFAPAQAVIDGDSMLVSSSEVANPVAVRFAWSETARPNLMNKEGLPACSFRTDNWLD
ncbi:MAG: sialate O-acetylesterase [Pirellula sp.]